MSRRISFKVWKSNISYPGGCAIGTRPINYHLDALKKLGMKYEIKDGYIYATAKNGLKGNNIKFPKNIGWSYRKFDYCCSLWLKEKPF